MSGPNVLIVDDEREVREVVARVAEVQGFSVAQAASVEEARAQMAQRSFGIFLLDIVMPNEGGLALLSEIRQTTPSAVVIMMTGNVAVAYAKSAMSRGAEAIVFKPFEDLEEISHALDEAAAKHARWQQVLEELRAREATAAA